MKNTMRLASLAFILACGATLPPLQAAGPADKTSAPTSGAAKKAPAKQESITTTRPAAADDAFKVSINAASAEELAQMMNGVGLKKAESIVRYREANGPFTSLEDLTAVPGIGAALVERNLPQIKL